MNMAKMVLLGMFGMTAVLAPVLSWANLKVQERPAIMFTGLSSWSHQKVVQSAPEAVFLKLQPQTTLSRAISHKAKQKHCWVHTLWQGGSPEHPTVLVCD